MNFITSILRSLDAVLEEVRIESLKEEIFYATVSIRSNTTLQKIDARPSDAIALAVATDAPIFVSEDVFTRAGVALPEGKTLHRIDAALVEEQPGQLSTETTPVLEEEFPKTEYGQNIQRVLRILMR